MPGSLTEYLEEGFTKHCPHGWRCYREKRLISPEAEKALGYSPRADVLLTNESASFRVWVEFEISRADPVANHAKFLTARHFGELAPEDAFLSMVSSHVARGRRNLASGMISIMRHMSVVAFQTVLLPHLREEEIFHLNHAGRSFLQRKGPDVRPELERAIRVCFPMFERGAHRIHFASDPVEVLRAVRTWNQEIKTHQGTLLWGGRFAQYFVHDPSSGDFAPSKFCAFLPVGTGSQLPQGIGRPFGMTLALYADLGEEESRFDGAIAWKHLVDRLGFARKEIAGDCRLTASFERWKAQLPQPVVMERRRTYAIVPPDWYLTTAPGEIRGG